MRCKACDVELTDKEAVRKDSHGEYYDMCGTCLQTGQLYEDEFLEDLENQYYDEF